MFDTNPHYEKFIDTLPKIEKLHQYLGDALLDLCEAAALYMSTQAFEQRVQDLKDEISFLETKEFDSAMLEDGILDGGGEDELD